MTIYSALKPCKNTPSGVPEKDPFENYERLHVKKLYGHDSYNPQPNRILILPTFDMCPSFYIRNRGLEIVPPLLREFFAAQTGRSEVQ
jgi:hypothetical protein